MGIYRWEEFQQEEYYNDLCEFFNNDIFGSSKYNDGKKWSSVIFVSRKAYCLYLLLKSKGVIEENGCRVYSDRYIMKNLDKTIFSNETVALIDDTVTTGRHMADVYNVVKKRTNANNVIPIVFAKDEEFSKSESSKRILEKYNFEIKFREEWDSSRILRFCSIETLIMYQEKIPYVIELPVLYEKEQNYITLTNEQFEKLKTAKNKWTYFECNESGYQQNNIDYGIMIMRDNSIAEFLSSFIFKFCVRLQITGDEKEKQIVAIPFAILKSAKYDELFRFFEKMYEGTSYCEAVEKYICDFQDEEGAAKAIYIAIYRGIVFNLSEYIGKMFAEYLKKEIIGDRGITVQEYHKEQNFEEEYSESTNEIFEKKFERYFLNVLNFENFTPIKVENSLRRYIDKFRGIQCDYRTVSLYLLAIINEIRYGHEEEGGINIESEQRDKFIPIEELQMTMYETFPEENKDKLDNILTMCICSMLGQSKLANEIFFDEESKIVYRGFKYGENSEAQTGLSAKIFYVAVETYYDKSSEGEKSEGETTYAQKYDIFLVTLIIFLSQYNLYGNIITKDEFKLYSEMYRERNPEELRRSIEAKKFLAEETKKPVYLEKLKEYIKDSDIYID